MCFTYIEFYAFFYFPIHFVLIYPVPSSLFIYTFSIFNLTSPIHAYILYVSFLHSYVLASVLRLFWSFLSLKSQVPTSRSSNLNGSFIYYIKNDGP